MPVLNEDARSHWLGRDNVGYTTIEGKQMPVLLDMGSECQHDYPGMRGGPWTPNGASHGFV